MLLLSLVSGLFLITSCESEYDHQIREGRKLVQQEMQLRTAIEQSGILSADAVKSLAGVKEEIEFHAHLSGNESLYITEMNSYKEELAQEGSYQQILISKYP